MMSKTILKRFFIISMFTALTAAAAFAQSTAFSFQGRLNDGTNPANGRYDLEFKLFNAVTGGTQIGSTLARPNLILINGVFSTTLDFGATAFNNPNNIFIEIAVKPNASPNALTILGPRQQLTSVPFALRAVNATNADNATNAQNSVNATNATNATTATTATNALSLGGVAASEYARLNIVNNGDLKATGNLTLGTTFGTNGNLNMSGDLTLTGSAPFGGGNLKIVGNAAQSPGGSGFVKAMAFIRVDREISGGTPTATIDRCFNGVTNSSVGNCGITIPNVYQQGFGLDINFGFPIENRFVALTSTVSTDAKVDVFVNSTTVRIRDGGVTTRFYIYVF